VTPKWGRLPGHFYYTLQMVDRYQKS
jgi:hypothetical protein